MQKEALFAPKERVLVGISGGIDSVCLWKVLCRLQHALGLGEIIAVYLDHGLRPGQTEAEAAWVCELASQTGHRCEVVHLQIAKEGASLQARARAERRRSLLALAELHQCTKIALGHHLDDQAETVLQRFLRGTGPRGLAGMWPSRDVWIRPLLCVSRREIHAVFEEQAWTWCEDPTNQQTHYQRNLLRHKLLPLLEKQYSPHLREHLDHLSWRSRQDEGFFEALIEARWCAPLVFHEGGILCLSLRDWKTLPTSLAWRCLQRALWEIFHTTVSEQQLMHLMEIAQACKGSTQASLPQPMRVVRVGEVLWFLAPDALPLGEMEPFLLPCLQEPWTYTTPWGMLEGRVIFSSDERSNLAPNATSQEIWRTWLPLPTWREPLLLRTRLQGDVVFGRVGQRRLKRWFIDQGIPTFFRDIWPLVAHHTDCLWVLGLTSPSWEPHFPCLELALTPSPWLLSLQRLFFAAEKRHLVPVYGPSSQALDASS